MSYFTDREAVARALEGLWRSAAPERSVKEDGRVMYRRRVFHILPHHFDLLIDVFADAECAVRLFTLEFTGPWHLGAASSTVSGAFDSEWAHWRWWIAPHAQAFLDNVLRKDPRTAGLPWQLHVPIEVGGSGAIDVATIAEGWQEYDIVAVKQDTLVFGERGFKAPIRPAMRHTKLSSDAFVRALPSETYWSLRRASLSVDASAMRRVAVIGAGRVGGQLARLFGREGHRVTLTGRDIAKPELAALARAVPGGAHIAATAEAVRDADVVLVALPWDAVGATLSGLDLRGKVVIDCTNPLAPGLQLAIGTTTSGAERVAQIATGAHVLKCFNTIGADSLHVPYSADGQRKDMYVCGDDAPSKAWLCGVVRGFGFQPVDCGALAQARLTEPLALLWISLAITGKWGRTHAFKLLGNPHSAV